MQFNGVELTLEDFLESCEGFLEGGTSATFSAAGLFGRGRGAGTPMASSLLHLVLGGCPRYSETAGGSSSAVEVGRGGGGLATAVNEDTSVLVLSEFFSLLTNF
jgi:hypothetical protein